MNVYNNFIHNSQNLWTTQMSFHGGILQHTLVHPHHETLFSNYKEGNINTKQSRWISRELHWAKNTNPNKLYNICSHLYNILEVTKSHRWTTLEIDKEGVETGVHVIRKEQQEKTCGDGNVLCLDSYQWQYPGFDIIIGGNWVRVQGSFCSTSYASLWSYNQLKMFNWKKSS